MEKWPNWKWHPGIGDLFWKPSFSGFMLTFGGFGNLWDLTKSCDDPTNGSAHNDWLRGGEDTGKDARSRSYGKTFGQVIRHPRKFTEHRAIPWEHSIISGCIKFLILFFLNKYMVLILQDTFARLLVNFLFKVFVKGIAWTVGLQWFFPRIRMSGVSWTQPISSASGRRVWEVVPWQWWFWSLGRMGRNDEIDDVWWCLMMMMMMMMMMKLTMMKLTTGVNL